MKKKCKLFGKFDAMDGGCSYCYYDNKELFNKCLEHKYSKEKGLKLTAIQNNDIIYIIPTSNKPLKIVVEESNDSSD